MAADTDTTKEEVSTGRQRAIPTQTRSRSRSRSAPRVHKQPVAPRVAAKTLKATQQSILAILNSATKAPPPWQGSMPTPPVPPLFSTIAACTNSLTIAPAPSALASATVGMSVIVQKHQTNSLSLLRSSAGPGKNFESKLALLQKSNVSLMMKAMAGVLAAGGTGFLLETLFKVARSKEKEAQRIFAMDRLVTVVSRRGRKSLSPPRKQ